MLSGYLIAVVAVTFTVASVAFAVGWGGAVRGQPPTMQKVAGTLTVAFVALQVVSAAGSVPAGTSARLTFAQQAALDAVVVGVASGQVDAPAGAAVDRDGNEVFVTLPSADATVDVAWLPPYAGSVGEVCARVDLDRTPHPTKCRGRS